MEAVIGTIVFIIIVSALFGGGDKASNKAKVSNSTSKRKPKSAPRVRQKTRLPCSNPACINGQVKNTRQVYEGSEKGYVQKVESQTCLCCYGKGYREA